MIRDLWEPGNRWGYLLSVGSAVGFAAAVWWLGTTVLDAPVTNPSLVEVGGAILLGVVLGGSGVAIHRRDAWRERWVGNVSLRLAVGFVVGLAMAILLDRAPEVAILGFVFGAAILVVGRTHAYVEARSPTRSAE